MKICMRQQTNLRNKKKANRNFTKQTRVIVCHVSVHEHFVQQGKSS